MIRRTFSIGFTLMMSLASVAQSNVIDEVVWVVGDEAIMKSDVEMARIEAQAQGQVFDGDPYCVIPEQLAVQKLFLHQAEVDSVEVSDSEVFQKVDERINDYIQLPQIGSKEKLEEYFGKSITQIRSQLFDMFKNQELVSSVQRDLISSIKVTPAQVRNYFKSMPEDSIPFVATQLELQILAINPVITQEEIDKVKNELRGYTERVNSGTTSFALLAKMYSEDKGSANQGGELGFLGRAELVPEFATAAFNLTNPNAISKIIQSEYGFHIIQLIEKRGDRVNVRHILRTPRVSDENLTEALHFMDSISDCIRRGQDTFENYVLRYSDDKETRANMGIMSRKVNPMEVTSKFDMNQLSAAYPEIARACAGMNIGEISEPIVMKNSKGREVVAIVKLKNKVNGHKATMADDYQQLQDVLVDVKSNEKLQAWIKEKQKNTYVRINEEWRDCDFQYPGWIK